MSNYNISMRNLLSLVSKVHEKGNRFIIQELKRNGVVGIVPSHGDILMCLYQNGRMSMKDISDKIRRTKPTVTVLIDKLEKLGLVERQPSETDNRSTNILLTQKGQEFKPVFEKISEDLNNMLYQNLSEQESDILENLLQKI